MKYPLLYDVIIVRTPSFKKKNTQYILTIKNITFYFIMAAERRKKDILMSFKRPNWAMRLNERLHERERMKLY